MIKYLLFVYKDTKKLFSKKYISKIKILMKYLKRNSILENYDKTDDINSIISKYNNNKEIEIERIKEKQIKDINFLKELDSLLTSFDNDYYYKRSTSGDILVHLANSGDLNQKFKLDELNQIFDLVNRYEEIKLGFEFIDRRRGSFLARGIDSGYFTKDDNIISLDTGIKY